MDLLKRKGEGGGGKAGRELVELEPWLEFDRFSEDKLTKELVREREDVELFKDALLPVSFRATTGGDGIAA